MSILLTEKQVAEQLQVSLGSIRRWRLENRGPRFVKVGALVRYRQNELDNWLAAQPVGGSVPSSPVLRSSFRGAASASS
jgi:excisionase family DNA binding protein